MKKRLSFSLLFCIALQALTLFGCRFGFKDLVAGLAILTHPKYPDTEKFPLFKDCPWFYRELGIFSPMPLPYLSDPWTLPKGETFRMKYRVVAFAGHPREAGLDDLWKEYASP